jgi:hypothetical protein
MRKITLKKDTVIPTIGLKEAFEKKCADKIVEEWNCPYEYSHQVPFPVHNRVMPEMIQQCFWRYSTGLPLVWLSKVARNLKVLDSSDPDSTASLQKDIAKGHESEIDDLLFNIIRMAEKS